MPSEKKPNEPPGPHQQGTPTVWLARMRESMARLTPGFFAIRTVREHTEQHSLLVAAAHHLRVADKSAVGRQIVGWQHSLLLAAMALLEPTPMSGLMPGARFTRSGRRSQKYENE